MARPTKYENETTVAKVDAITNAMIAEKFFDFCGVEHIAYALGIHKDTVYEWVKKYDEFSEAIKRWETKRNMLFYKLAASQQVQPGKWIFLAKNWLGMTDRQEVSHGGQVEHIHIMSIEDFQASKEAYDEERGKTSYLN